MIVLVSKTSVNQKPLLFRENGLYLLELELYALLTIWEQKQRLKILRSKPLSMMVNQVSQQFITELLSL